MRIAKEFILREIAGECVLVPTGARKDAVGFISQLLQAGFVACTKEDKTW